MTTDEILAKVREAREQESRGCIGSNVSELCDLVEQLVARALDLQQDLTEALDYAEHTFLCDTRRGPIGGPWKCTCGLDEIVARAYPPADAPPVDRIPGEVEAVARRMIVTGRQELAVPLADGRTARLRIEGRADSSRTTDALDALIATLPELPRLPEPHITANERALINIASRIMAGPEPSGGWGLVAPLPDDRIAWLRVMRITEPSCPMCGDNPPAPQPGADAREPPEPPPGKMRVTASVPVTYDVSPGQIGAYMRAKGWAANECTGGTAYHRDAGATIVSVRHDEASNWHECFARSLDIIATAEERSTGEVLRDIAAMEEA